MPSKGNLTLTQRMYEVFSGAHKLTDIFSENRSLPSLKNLNWPDPAGELTTSVVRMITYYKFEQEDMYTYQVSQENGKYDFLMSLNTGDSPMTGIPYFKKMEINVSRFKAVDESGNEIIPTTANIKVNSIRQLHETIIVNSLRNPYDLRRILLEIENNFSPDEWNISDSDDSDSELSPDELDDDDTELETDEDSDEDSDEEWDEEPNEDSDEESDESSEENPDENSDGKQDDDSNKKSDDESDDKKDEKSDEKPKEKPNEGTPPA